MYWGENDHNEYLNVLEDRCKLLIYIDQCPQISPIIKRSEFPNLQRFVEICPCGLGILSPLSMTHDPYSYSVRSESLSVVIHHVKYSRSLYRKKNCRWENKKSSYWNRVFQVSHMSASMVFLNMEWKSRRLTAADLVMISLSINAGQIDESLGRYLSNCKESLRYRFVHEKACMESSAAIFRSASP